MDTGRLVQGHLVIGRGLWRTMLDHVLGTFPNEGCGVVAGQNGMPVHFFPCRNVHPQPINRYRADAHDLLQAYKQMADRQWDLIATFHSHPAAAAWPSAIDVAEALDPEILYLIVSLVDPAAARPRGFWIRFGRITEHPVQVD